MATVTQPETKLEAGPGGWNGEGGARILPAPRQEEISAPTAPTPCGVSQPPAARETRSAKGGPTPYEVSQAPAARETRSVEGPPPRAPPPPLRADEGAQGEGGGVEPGHAERAGPQSAAPRAAGQGPPRGGTQPFLSWGGLGGAPLLSWGGLGGPGQQNLQPKPNPPTQTNHHTPRL